MLGSCKKDYLTGGSLHQEVTPLNNIDYLKSNSFKLFDTAVIVIEKLGLTAQVNSAKTFFAFTDYSVLNMINLRLQQKQQVNPLATYTLDSLISNINEDSVRQYILNETVELKTAPELVPATYTSAGNTTMGVLKQLQTNATYLERTQAPTYLLFYVKVRGALDQPGVTPPVNQNDITVQCQTTGIKTSNGATTMHVLVNPHTFVRF
ncbi:MAG TPA: hypothetical protein DHW64_06295 [Chitinophagaceae bacterium]|nr:hypothetical protein [Chitinophagaceae bacterium]